MNTTTKTEILFAAADVAQALGVQLYDLQNLHPVGFGVPGHWRLTKASAVVYTERGVAELVEDFARRGQTSAAARLHSLLVAERAKHETPSRPMHGDWRDRADLK